MKNTFKTAALLLAIGLSGLIASGVSAQQGPGVDRTGRGPGYDAHRGPGNALSSEKREQIRNKIEAIKIWRLTETLKLDAATSARLAALMSSYEQQRRSRMQQHRDAVQELRMLVQAQKPDTTKIETVLDKLESSHAANQKLMEAERTELRKLLTPEQQARYVIFQQDFRRDMQKMIGNARGGQGRGTLRPGGPRGQLSGPDNPEE